MFGQRIGSIRVSTFDQHAERQLEGIDAAKTFTDKVSGKNTKRPQLEALFSLVTKMTTSSISPMKKDQTTPEHIVRPHTIISVSLNPASFVQQMTTDDSATSSADGFKAVWLLYCAALIAHDVDTTAFSNNQNTKAKDRSLKSASLKT